MKKIIKLVTFLFFCFNSMDMLLSLLVVYDLAARGRFNLRHAHSRRSCVIVYVVLCRG